LERQPRKVFDQQNLNTYIQSFVGECQRRGVGIGQPVDSRVLNIQLGHGHAIDELEAIFRSAAESKCKFIMLLTALVDKPVHEVLKKYEQTYGIITQNVTSNQCLERFVKHRGKKPERVLIYRNGCSEGQFEMVLKYEIPLIRAIVKQHTGSDKFAVIVATKLHPARLVPAQINPQGKAPEQNLKPGTLVDTGITHPYFNEFFLLGHLGRLGTAKVPRFTIISNPGKIPSDDIKKLTYQLAFGHQIITGTTGLPSPCYIADEFAKRGRMIFKAHISSQGSGSHDSNKSLFEQANERYTYKEIRLASDNNTLMRDVRFNA